MTPNYLYDHSANLILYWERQGTFWRHLDISYRFLCIWHVCKMSVGVVMVITEKERLYSGMMLCFVWDLNQYFVEVELKSFKYKDHLSSLCHDKLSCIPHTCKYYYYTQQFMWSLVRKKIEHPLTWPSHCA